MSRASKKSASVALVNAAAGESHVSAQVVQLVKRSRFNPIRHLTPELLSKQMDAFQIGFLRDFALMAEAIKRRDYMIKISLPKREKAIARHGISIVIKDGLDDAQKVIAQEQQSALRFFYDNLTASNILDQNQRGGFRLLVQQMMEAVGFRYAVHEIIWQPTIDPVTNKPRLTAAFNYVPLSFFESTTGKLRFIKDYFGSMMGEPMEDDGWLVTVGEGLMESLAVCYMFKSMSLKDWLSFNERFGTPGIHAKTSATKGSQQWNDLVEAVQKFSQEFAAVTSMDSQISLIEAKGGASETPFNPLIQLMDRAIATLCRGADLSTISSGAHSEGRGASLQGDEADVLEEDDAAMISETLNLVDKIVVRELFGNVEAYAQAKIIVPERKNNADIINKLGFLRAAGVPVGIEYARQELGVPAPSADEETLQPIIPIQPVDDEEVPEKLPALANVDAKAAANGRQAIFNANAAAQQIAAKRKIFKPIADRLAKISAIQDPDAFKDALVALKHDSHALYASVMAKAPTLAKPLQAIIGTALVSGYADAAAARKPKKP